MSCYRWLEWIEAGAIEADEAEVIQNVLSLQGKTVSEIMTPRTVVFSLGADAALQEVKDNSGLLNYSRIPVFDKDADDVVAMALRRDLLTAMADGQGETRVDLMRPVDFVAQSQSVDRLLRMLMERRQHLSMVVDGFRDLVGLVSLEEILARRSSMSSITWPIYVNWHGSVGRWSGNGAD